MTETAPPEVPPTVPLHDALVKFTGAVGGAVDICNYGLTVGTNYVPFDADPEDDCEDDEGEAECSQLWVRVTGINPLPGTDAWGGDCAITLQIGLEVGVLRCFPIIEEGEAPTATQVLEAALEALDDMQAIQCAAMTCEVWDRINIGAWTPLGPDGGQYGGTWSFTVEL